MEHRRLLAHSAAHRPFMASGLFERVGGSAAVDSLIDGLYDRVQADPALRPLFGRDLTTERAAQKRFFTEWLGGDSVYSDRAYFPLKHRHDLIPITPVLAERWLAHFRQSLSAAVRDQGARTAIDAKATELALALVNESTTASALRARPHGMCLRYQPASASLSLAGRGDAAGLRALLAESPDVLASVTLAARLLQIAATGGHAPVIELLLNSGVDVNAPSPIGETLVLVTALCIARVKRKNEVAALLVRRGAQEDIFTNAFTGDLPRLRDDLARGPDLAQAIDPAVDALEITPVHHAVVGGRADAVNLLLARVAEAKQPVVGGARALREAVQRHNVVMVKLLLERGASVRAVGAGRWVLHPELAPLLARAGARVESTGDWIGLSCTGNQGRRDDPDFVAALLRHGARVDDRRLVGQDTDGGQGTALHYAAKAGFLRTIAVLLEHGADPSARDQHGRIQPTGLSARQGPSTETRSGPCCGKTIPLAKMQHHRSQEDHDIPKTEPSLLALSRVGTDSCDWRLFGDQHQALWARGRCGRPAFSADGRKSGRWGRRGGCRHIDRWGADWYGGRCRDRWRQWRRGTGWGGFYWWVPRRRRGRRGNGRRTHHPACRCRD